MTTQPLISVIIPAYNREEYLGPAVESALAQSYPTTEIIVVDDGSNDATARIAQSYPIRYVYQTHTGLGAALNRGIEHATGAFFSFLDSDDLRVEPKLAHQMELFHSNPGLEAVFGHLVQFQIDTRTGTEIVSPPVEGYFKGTLLITRKAFFRVGLFDPRWNVGDFIDWYLRALECGLKSAMLAEVVQKRRIHATNMGLTDRANYTAYVQILKRSLDRRRAETR